MFFSKAPLSLASALLFASAQANYLNTDISFGHDGKISPNMRAVPNFHLMGNPNPPEILSNKIVLTPPAPGNQRGAAWSEKPLMHSAWTVDVDFRATGPERGGGNFMVYLAKDGRESIGTSSIYTVGKFDGLALVVDQHAGSAGFIRGFLNDGSTEYKSHHSVDSLAFGHCEYSYRNLGRPSRVSIRQSDSSFKVTVDNKPCFESNKIKIPLGYYFGISAASAENPDSFEVFKFVTTTDSHSPDAGAGGQPPQEHQYEAASPPPTQQQNDQPPQQQEQPVGDIPVYADAPAEKFTSSAEQFADLHNRLQAMMKTVTALSQQFSTYQQQSLLRHESLLSRVTAMESSLKQLESTANVMRDVQTDVRQTKSDLHNALDRKVANLETAVRNSHSGIVGSLAETGTGIGKFVLVVVASQATLIVLYALYKRRKANGPKKYL